MNESNYYEMNDTDVSWLIIKFIENEWFKLLKMNNSDYYKNDKVDDKMNDEPSKNFRYPSFNKHGAVAE